MAVAMKEAVVRNRGARILHHALNEIARPEGKGRSSDWVVGIGGAYSALE